MTAQDISHKPHQPASQDKIAAKIKNLWIAVWILSGAIIVLLIWLTVLTAQLPGGESRPHYRDPYKYAPGNYNNLYR